MRRIGVAVSLSMLLAAFAVGVSVASASPGAVLARGGHISTVALPFSQGGAVAGSRPLATCTTPGSGNYMTDCNNVGRAVNETWIATNGSSYVAGANDYNSLNGQADLGYYTSTNAKTWTDNGPLGLFEHGTDQAAGDPGLAMDASGVVYYSGIAFSYTDCNYGGNELARYDPNRASWSFYQIANDSDSQFQDKPAIAIDSQHVFESWTQYGSCTGVGVASPIKVAVLPLGAQSVPPLAILKVPHSHYSQGSSMAVDGHGGFWITWEEYPSPDATVGSIWLAHWKGQGQGWTKAHKISPAGFTDLSNPLPGFVFRDNSFPVMALDAGSPVVAWCSSDTGTGRSYLYQEGTVTMLSNNGDDQFFPSIGVDSGGNVAVSWSQTNTGAGSYDQFLSYNVSVTKISGASSLPGQDNFFGGQFIGDYNGMAVQGTGVHPIWTSLTRNDPQFGGKAQDAMVYAP